MDAELGTAGGIVVRVLGPVELSAGGVLVPVAQPGLRVLLALLALEAGRSVSMDALVAAVWGPEEASRAREQNLQGRVYQLRRVLAGAEPGRAEPRLVTAAPGYRLVLAREELDVAAFRQDADNGRTALRAGDAGGAVDLFTRGLGLWRGAALADIAGMSQPLGAAAAGLEEQRLATAEDRAEAMLAVGRHGELAGELAGLVAEHPLRERMQGLLMVALYRSGRQADALAVYQRARVRLAEELGIDPGPELRDLHERILRADPALAALGGQMRLGAAEPSRAGNHAAMLVAGGHADGDGPGTGAADRGAGHAGVAVPRQLPPGTRNFAGREAELKELDEALDGAAGPAGAVVITAIGGTGGVGKTALALHWAHRAADRFPDGQLYVNLRGFDPGGTPVTAAEAIRGFLDGLGVPPERIPASLDAQAGLYRSLIAGRAMLIVADNARDAAQVRPLLPASAASLVLVTSRDALAGLTATDGARPVRLGTLTGGDARDLLAARLGPDRLAAEPEATEAMVAGCAGLPLALAITAARAAAAPALPLAALAAELAGRPGQLDALDAGEPATSVRDVFSWSYRQLTAPAGRLFRLLGIHPGPDITVPAAASLAAVPRSQARSLLAELTAASLLNEHAPGRYALHDLLRAYAAERAREDEADGDRHAAITRTLDHYLHTGHQASQYTRFYGYRTEYTLGVLEAGTEPEDIAGQEHAYAWFQAERPVMMSCIALAAANGFDIHARLIAWIMVQFLAAGGYFGDLIASQQAAVAAAERAGDRHALAQAQSWLGATYMPQGRHAEAIAGLLLGASLCAECGDVLRQARVLAAAAGELELIGDYLAGLEHARQALSLFAETGDTLNLGYVHNILASLLVRTGDLGAARLHVRQALEAFADAGDDYGQSGAWATLGRIEHASGDHDKAIGCYEQVTSLLRDLPDAWADQASVLDLFGDAYHALGDGQAARDAWERAASILEDYNNRDAIPIRGKLRQG